LQIEAVASEIGGDVMRPSKQQGPVAGALLSLCCLRHSVLGLLYSADSIFAVVCVIDRRAVGRDAGRVSK
jgi:hypothetical protein